MKRASLLALLRSYTPVDHQEQQAKEKIISFVEQHENCFERSLEVGHITASSLLLSKDGSRALLMHHRKLNKWFQLGGHCDGESDVLAVAIKEAQEESGIQHIVPVSRSIFDVDVHLIPENKKEKAHYHYDVRFLLQVASDEDFIQNSESKELKWVNKRDTLPTTEESVARLVRKWNNLTN